MTRLHAEWNDEMTDAPRFAAAADMGWGQIKGNGGTDRPGYDVVVGFRSAVSELCGSDNAAIIVDVIDDISCG